MAQAKITYNDLLALSNDLWLDRVDEPAGGRQLAIMLINPEHTLVFTRLSQAYFQLLADEINEDMMVGDMPDGVEVPLFTANQVRELLEYTDNWCRKLTYISLRCSVWEIKKLLEDERDGKRPPREKPFGPSYINPYRTANGNRIRWYLPP